MDSQECTFCRLNSLAAQSSVEAIGFFTLLYKAKYTQWHAARKSCHPFDGYGKFLQSCRNRAGLIVV
jgi:hypothetical protein